MTGPKAWMSAAVVAASLAAGPAASQSAEGIAPPSAVSCRSFVAMGSAAEAGGSAWNAAAVQRLFYVAYAMGVIDEAASNVLERAHEGALLDRDARRTFQDSLRDVDRSLAALCALNPDEALGDAIGAYEAMRAKDR